VVGGVGADSVLAGAGNDTIAGDNAQIDYYTNPSQVQTIQTTDSLVDHPDWGDTIVAGEGTNVVLGGLGDDHINDPTIPFSAGAVPGAGNDYVAGDNGEFNFDAAGNPVSFESTELGFGGDDVIYVGDGNNVVIGGFGADQLFAGEGNDTIAGDNAQIDFFTGSSIVSTAQTTDTTAATGGDDVIDAGNGDNLVFGGVGNDYITTGNGADIVLGDNGTATFDPSGAPLLVYTGDPLLGGNDTISTGDGNDIAMGGAFNDIVLSAGGNDILFGDGGLVSFSAGGTQLYIISLDPLIGGNDILNGGTGNDILIGGAGSDLLYGNLSEDLLFGDNAAVTLKNGKVTNIQADFNDLITKSLFDEFNFTPEGGEEESLPPGVTAALGAPGEDGLPNGLLDSELFRRLFGSSLAALQAQPSHDEFVIQVPAGSDEEGTPPQSGEDEPEGQTGAPDGETEPAQPPATALPVELQVALHIAPTAASTVNERDGDVLAAALAAAALLAVKAPKSRSRTLPDWETLAGAAGEVLRLLRRAGGSIPRK